MQRRLSGSEDIQQVQLSVSSTVSTEKAQQDITRLMRERRRLARDADDDFNIMDQQEIANTISGTTRTLTALLAAVAAISLLVGGIGIMNIMLVSVTERTREIGIRLAIGAFERDVLTQFLIEAVVLSLFGGTIGISLALAASYAAARALSLPFTLDYSIIALAFAFSPRSALSLASSPRGERQASTPSKRSGMNDTTQSGGHSRRYALRTLIVASIMGAGCGVRRPYQPPVPNAPATWSAPVPESADAERLSRWWDPSAMSSSPRSFGAPWKAISMCARRCPGYVKRGNQRIDADTAVAVPPTSGWLQRGRRSARGRGQWRHGSVHPEY